MSDSHSPVLEQYFERLREAVESNNGLPVLDLACGQGRNGLYLQSRGLPVVFADRNSDSLSAIKPHITEQSRLWLTDLELAGSLPLAGHQYSAIIVFRYLHRPLFDAIKTAVQPDGVVIYETFTTEQASIGRPKNPDFLLRPGELRTRFDDWQELDYFEGMEEGRAIARIVASN